MVAAPNAEVERLASGSYVSLTTFKKDGTGVATAVWVSHDTSRLFVWTEAGSGKVKRIRNGARVLLAPCDSRGGLQGTQIEGTAHIVEDPAQVALIQSLHKKKYGLQFRMFEAFAAVFRRSSGGHVGVEITVP
jgi:PPOX class probable F420-dependent enzyme